MHPDDWLGEIRQGRDRSEVAQILVAADGVDEGEIEEGLEKSEFIAAGRTFAVAVPEPGFALVGEVESGAVLLPVQWTAVVAGFGWTLKEV